jgi:hypothetical protein
MMVSEDRRSKKDGKVNIKCVRRRIGLKEKGKKRTSLWQQRMWRPYRGNGKSDQIYE